MLSAKSMYFGGEIVEAIDVNLDWDSYKELGLLCPFCNEPVFLCGETVRQRKSDGKLSYVQPHFKHFPGGDPTDLDCEKRYFTPEGERYIDAMRAERRGQRLELFNRYFWEIVRDGSKASDLSHRRKTSIPGRAVKLYFQAWQDLGGRVINDQISKDIDLHCGLMLPNLDKKLQKSILSEVCAFLSSRSSLGVWKRLIEYIFYNEGNRERDWTGQEKFYPYVSKDFYNPEWGLDALKEELMQNLFVLCMIPWQQQLEEKAKLKEQTRGKDFVKK